jgi:hypothetical protein
MQSHAAVVASDSEAIQLAIGISWVASLSLAMTVTVSN